MVQLDQIGGTPVNQKVTSTILDLPNNKTLFIQKFTDRPESRPEAVEDLQTVQAVFEHYKPTVNIEFQDETDATVRESMTFTSVKDFNTKDLVERSAFLNSVNSDFEEYKYLLKQISNNRKRMQSIMSDATMKEAFVNSLKQMIEELK